MEKKKKKDKKQEPWAKAVKNWIIYAVVIITFVTVFMQDTTINTKTRKEYSINNPYQKKLSPLLERGTEGKKKHYLSSPNRT